MSSFQAFEYTAAVDANLRRNFMAIYNWQEFLLQWSQEILQSPLAQRSTHLILPETAEAGWLGYPGATEDAINEAEAYFGLQLPVSYREFLAITNGWSLLTQFVWKIAPVEDINWYREHHGGNISLLEEGEEEEADPLPGNPLLAAAMRGRAAERQKQPREQPEPLYGSTTYVFNSHLLSNAIDIGASWEGYTDAVDYILDPRMSTISGEWDAWVVRWWKPAEAIRYRSFWDLMQAEYQGFLELYQHFLELKDQ